LGDTWLFDGGAWRQAAPSEAPSARFSHAMAYDSLRQRTVLFGGATGTGAASELGDTWEWDGSNWRQIDVPGPPARARHAMGFDPVRGEVILYGGELDRAALTDTWTFDGARWRLISEAVPAAPTSARDYSLFYVPELGTMAMYTHRDIWALAGDEWRVLSEDHRGSGQAAYDPIRRRLFLLNWGDDLYEWTPPCLADCNCDDAVDFFDFLCFQDRFATGDLAADCDFSGDLSFFDFLCFQDRFAEGCR
jgi:hypothetical protein